MMWAAGTLASISSITYPAISAFVSMHSDADKQGTNFFFLHTAIHCSNKACKFCV